MFNFLGKLPEWLQQFVFPASVYQGSSFSTSLPALIFFLFYSNHPFGCEVTSSCWTCLSLMTNEVKSLYMYLLAICISLEKHLSIFCCMRSEMPLFGGDSLLVENPFS